MSDEKKAKSRKKLPATSEEKVVVYTQEMSDFVDYYIQNRLKDAEDCYHRAYPKCKESACASSASRLLRSAKIQALLKHRLEIATGHIKENLEHKILEMWFTRAFYDPGDILDDEGRLRHTMSKLKSMGLSVVIEGVDVKPDKDGGEHFVYKLADRDRAMDQLQKYIAMIKPQPTLNLNLNKDVETMTAEEEGIWKENIRAVFPEIDSGKE
jgi:hypothetical protein